MSISFGEKSEPQKCERCFRTKDEAIRGQKEKGSICKDAECTFKQAIRDALGADAPPLFVSKFCNRCGNPYYKPISNFCSNCGKERF